MNETSALYFYFYLPWIRFKTLVKIKQAISSIFQTWPAGGLLTHVQGILYHQADEFSDKENSFILKAQPYYIKKEEGPKQSPSGTILKNNGLFSKIGMKSAPMQKRALYYGPSTDCHQTVPLGLFLQCSLNVNGKGYVFGRMHDKPSMVGRY